MNVQVLIFSLRQYHHHDLESLDNALLAMSKNKQEYISRILLSKVEKDDVA